MNIHLFQEWSWQWMLDTFGTKEEISKDRSFRFLEEALELAQCTGVKREDVHELIDYVFARESGDPHGEIGDVLLTLAGVASVHDVSMRSAAVAVQKRALKNAAKIAAKRKKRPTNGSALP